jgi:heme A synthase
MQSLHAQLASGVVAGAALLVVSAGLAAWLDRGHAWIRRAALVMMALLVGEVLVGGIVYLGGGRPGEALHLLYGIAVLAVLPIASTFAADAPRRAYSGVLAVAAAVVLLLAWRLLSTG